MIILGQIQWIKGLTPSTCVGRRFGLDEVLNPWRQFICKKRFDLHNESMQRLKDALQNHERKPL